MGKAAKCRSIGQYFRGMSLNSSYRTKIGRVFRSSLQEKGLGRTVGGGFPCNSQTREIMADSVFVVENELESRNGGQPDHPQVRAMNGIRNRVLDDLGWNE